ncbi:MAG: nitroreductase family protein [Clostridia bacterium]|nr:nitroreductase family protein [Clostridia bacterium]
MELQGAIKGRRSIRGYISEEIDQEVIRELVKSAQLAPSWKNSQTARFYVALSREAKERVRDSLADFNRERTKDASAFIVTTVVHGISGYTSEGKPTHLGNGFECFDNGLAVENLLLSAYEKGYGTLIMGLYNEAGLREQFSIPAEENVLVVIALGKAGLNPDTPKRKDLDEILKIL